jgi:TRAP transporter TAXI family solute receptor
MLLRVEKKIIGGLEMKFMKKRSVTLLLVVLMIMTAFLQGCSSAPEVTTGEQKPEESKPEVKSEPVMLRAVSGASGGLWQIYGTTWGKIVEDYTDIQVQVEAVGGGYANVASVNEDPNCLGMTQNAAAYEGARGLNWAKDKKYEDIRGLFPVYPSSLHFWASEKSGIKTIADFEGKVISVGPAGGTDTNVKQLFELLGVKPREFINQNFADLVQAMQDGLIDGVCVSTGHPHSTISELEQSMNINHIPPTPEQIKLITEKEPYYSVIPLPANTYKNQPEEINMLAFYSFAICHKDLDEESAYQITKAVLEHNDELVAAVKAAKDSIAENVVEIKHPLHPGAYRYYQEIGIEVPDAAKPID